MAPRYSREWLEYFIPETIDWHPDGTPDIDRAVMKNLVGPRSKYPHGVPDAKTVHRYEGFASYQRIQELVDQPIPGRFDLKHFQRIHHHLFQDVYPWAGQLRTAPRDWPMVKMGPDVAAVRAGQRHVTEIPHSYFKASEVPQAAAAVLDRIAAKDNLRGLARGPFLDELTKVWARVNFVHPFREGNTRTQFAFFRQLSAEAGYTLDTERFKAPELPESEPNTLVGDLREQFVWGRFEYIQTGDTRLLRDALDAALTVTAEPSPHGPPTGGGLDVSALAAATLGHLPSAGLPPRNTPSRSGNPAPPAFPDIDAQVGPEPSL